MYLIRHFTHWIRANPATQKKDINDRTNYHLEIHLAALSLLKQIALRAYGKTKFHL